MIEVETVNANRTISLLAAIEALYPLMMLIHVFLDNARYYHAKAVQEWPAMPGQTPFRSSVLPSFEPH